MNVQPTYANTRTAIKVAWRFNDDPEDNVTFINGMSAQGWKLVSIAYDCKLTFEPCEPGAYLCAYAFTLKSSGFFDTEKYRQLAALLTSDGATVIPQTITFGSQTGVFALRPASRGTFEINTDLDSKIADYKGRMKYFTGLAMAFFSLGISQGTIAINGFVGLPGATPGFAMLALGFIYAIPANKYRKTLARLKQERSVSE
jgi:hypothetical protein